MPTVVPATLTLADVRAMKRPDQESHSQAYAELGRMVRGRGLMDRQPMYYLCAMAESIVLLAIAISILMLASSISLALLSLAFWCLASARAAFVMHDAGHRQIGSRAFENNLIGWVFANLILGVSINAWRRDHNAHHVHTNEIGVDPDLAIPVWARIEEQAAETKGWVRWMVKHQAYAFFFVLTLSGFGFKIEALRDIFVRHKDIGWAVSSLALVLHHVLYFALLFTVLPWWQAAFFFSAHYLITGLHLGLSFAPNHKGMPLVEANHQMDFLYVQLITTRNIVPSTLKTYFFGGLNYQVEHHLFPGMPRNNLGRAREIVKVFCEDRGLPYYETSLIESYRQILEHFHSVGTSLR
jgi:fatty acid desaturase